MADSDPDPEPPSYSFYLPVIMAPHIYDMVQFMSVDTPEGKGPLYEVMQKIGGHESQARHQTQVVGERFYHTKGNEIKAEWEQLWADDHFIYRGTDTSPGNNQYYTLYASHEDGTPPGSAWSPRFWQVGELYERNPFVVFYYKSDCTVVMNGGSPVSGYQRTWLRFEAFYPSYTFESGITLDNVVELTWLLSPDGNPIESYFYAEGFGLVGWGSSDRGYSYINEEHQPGQRPDNTRETIQCLDATPSLLRRSLLLNTGPLPYDYRVK